MQRDQILQILSKYKQQHQTQYGIQALGIFGSVARDESSPDSDLDICIVTDTPDPYILVHIKEDLELETQQKIDIVRVREKMNPYLKSRIDREGIYV